jgi:lipoate-protein ligase A
MSSLHQKSLSCSEDVEMTTRLFTALHVYHDDAAHSAAMNMALDEALLEHATVPSIRFYQWHSPALSFGYFGKFADVAAYAPAHDLVRRWTGGGIVLHGDDLTYSIVIPVGDTAFTESSMSIYEKIHRALSHALNGSGERAVVAGGVDPRRGGFAKGAAVTAGGYNCFANPVRADVTIDGRKVAGAAQRRTRAGLLQQGSIQGVAELAKDDQLLQSPSAAESANSSRSSWATQPVQTTGCPSGVKRVDLGNALADRFARALSANCSERKINEEILNRARELAQRKYGTDSWLRKR